MLLPSAKQEHGAPPPMDPIFSYLLKKLQMPPHSSRHANCFFSPFPHPTTHPDHTVLDHPYIQTKDCTLPPPGTTYLLLLPATATPATTATTATSPVAAASPTAKESTSSPPGWQLLLLPALTYTLVVLEHSITQLLTNGHLTHLIESLQPLNESKAPPDVHDAH